MEPGGAWRLTPAPPQWFVPELKRKAARARAGGTGAGSRTTHLCRDQTSNMEPSAGCCAPRLGSHGPGILQLAPSHGQCAAWPILGYV